MSRPATPAYTVRRQGYNSSLSASATASTSRTGTPAPRNPVISLDEWESKAHLSDEQLGSIGAVKDRYGERPLPAKFGGQNTRPSTPAQSLAGPQSPNPAQATTLKDSLSSNTASHLSSSIPDPLHPSSIATPQQFLDHFTALTLSTEHEQDSLYRDHLAEISGLRENCEMLIELLKGGEEEVQEMEKCLSYVEERSESLRGACEDLLEEQTHLLTHTSQLAHRLTFFTFLETATKILNNPGNALVLNPDFLPMVKRLDECIGYLSDHRDFRDSEIYLLRYQQCMTRSMTLIKLYFVGTIRSIGQEVGKRLADQSLSETAIQALIYTKFTSLSTSLRPLLSELEQRVSTNPDELAPLLSECNAAYVSTRRNLMGGRVNEEIGRMKPNGSDLVDLTRAGCGYLKTTCMDEFLLYKHFFLSGEAQLYGFLESLCDYLYDHLRPRILHEPSLQVLCGVCTVLQALMVQDIPDEDEDDGLVFHSPAASPGSPYYGNGDDYFSSKPRLYHTGSSRSISHQSSRRRASSLTGNGSPRSRAGSFAGSPGASTVHLPPPPRKKTRKPLRRLHIEVLLRMVLQDAQTRLVFRAQTLLSAEVEYYAPKESDLDYPDRLKSGPQGNKLVPRQTTVSLNADDEDDTVVFELPSLEVQNSWYPSLKSTLWVLSCLYTFVDSAVFDDLAQEAVIACRKSLAAASDLLLAKQGKEKSMDSKLFLIRHLLILKEMTAALDLGKTRRREWSGVGDFLRSLLDNASSLLGYQRGSVARSAAYAPDARTNIDRSLKSACEDLISILSVRSTFPLQDFIGQCSTYLARAASSTTSTKSDLSAQAFAKPEKVKEVHEEFKKISVKAVEDWKKELRLYLLDEETVAVLMPPALNSIVDTYRQFHDLIRAEYDFAVAAGVMTPSGVKSMLESTA
ncbi:hypothetical protein L202_04287 [Cryptococcus amylolentus CBS 6039]|uniref:Conserved oligomeric Golgi complex subunit 3 n=1 Tax=Cryptococcus amylolentus CBS 6039 TaxID=1295533 RepID=A0A1E3HQS5_9TREE|nr:hypothetical protein L202_04287 [Cryptococcus amylolentus CBS 6039]ODN78720.1 hypothetical protein L202_04287 [Cryptococcus amylolentus CBS 6039]